MPTTPLRAAKIGVVKKIDLLSDGILTIQEAAAILKVDRHLIGELVRSGELAHVKIGPRQTRIPKAALNQFLADRLKGAA